MVTGATLGDLTSSLTTMERTANELSSGHTILEPSDNPYGASRMIDLQSQLDGLSRLRGRGPGRDLLGEHGEQRDGEHQHGRSSACGNCSCKAGNGTNNQSDLETIALEVEQLTEGVKQDANMQYAGQYVFSGTLTTTAPYQPGADDEYQGNAETVSRAIGPGASVMISTNLSTLLGNGQAAEDGKLLDTLRTIATNLRSGTDRRPRSARARPTSSISTGTCESLSQLQATAGSATDQLQAALSRNEDLQTSIAEACRARRTPTSPPHRSRTPTSRPPIRPRCAPVRTSSRNRC